MTNSSFIFISLLFLLFAGCSEPPNEPASEAQPISEAIAPKTTADASAVALSESKPQESLWSYYQFDDEMGNGTIYLATISSTNTVNFDFPYSGDQHAELKLRIHPRHGSDVIFKIEKGQFLCTSYEGCNVLVRFDDEKATNFSAIGPADNSTETLFIHNYNRFVEKIRKSKKVRISANIYQEGAPVFEFDVSGFDQNKYKPKK